MTEEKGEGIGEERFAVVKRLCDPQKYSKESMVEMILEKRIGRPEEVAGLSLGIENSVDEHHDVIVKVFRQVWFELSPGRLGSECRCRRRVG